MGVEPSLRSPGERRAKPYRSDRRFGILNPWGELWTDDTFLSEAEAREHVRTFWKRSGFPDTTSNPRELAKFKIVPVRVTVSVSNRKDGSTNRDTPSRPANTVQAEAKDG